VFPLAELGMEPRALCMLGKCSCNEPHPQTTYKFLLHMSLSVTCSATELVTDAKVKHRNGCLDKAEC
jgi:hypothetical protein